MKSRSWRIGLAAVAVSALVGSGLIYPALAAASTGWTQPGYGPQRAFYNPEESVVNAATINDITHRWHVTLPDVADSCTGRAEPLIANGRLFLADESGIGAYHAATGAPLWHDEWGYPEDETTPHLAVSGGLLLIGNSSCQSQSDPDGNVFAVDVATGKQRWMVSIGAPVESLVVDKGVVVVAGSSMSDEAAVHAFRVSDGKARWNLRSYSSAGVSANGRLLVGRADKAITAAVSVTTGKVLWSKTKRWYGRSASPAGDRFFVSDDGGNLVCLKASNGALVWTAKKSAGLVATDGRRVYREMGEGVEALDVKNGKRLWVTYFEDDSGQPVRAGGLVYTNAGILHAATGAVASFGWPVGGLYADQHVVVAGGRLYAVHGDTLKAYAP
ncbi:outer membrane protein assembly factor BamB family protein [Jidongwangia harbinensis]|uniref:outer membrane protein assembly factor BamB family protein n=1 Tax=Jidongwangia harbinensis TaxID=2878561 RepID=UPI001CD9D659|nr:PQQ-binding-like beta-propeller repeat protein [Jidongwangia harbinensis]MCA2214144.1 PQQ-binding-like beta-propeller repeat protein [Jidongwangia harbinensis]